MGKLEKLIRKLIGVRSSLSESEAIYAARQICLDRGWPWNEPIMIFENVLSFEIITNTSIIGNNVRMTIDARNGNVINASYPASNIPK